MSDLPPPHPPHPQVGPGGRIKDGLVFTPLRIAVLTVSDTRDAESDTSGALLAGRVAAAGHTLVARDWVADTVVSRPAAVIRSATLPE